MHQNFVARIDDGPVVEADVGVEAFEAVADFDRAGHGFLRFGEDTHDFVPLLLIEKPLYGSFVVTTEGVEFDRRPRGRVFGHKAAVVILDDADRRVAFHTRHGAGALHGVLDHGDETAVRHVGQKRAVGGIDGDGLGRFAFQDNVTVGHHGSGKRGAGGGPLGGDR